MDTVDDQEIPPDAVAQTLIIQTIDSVRYQFLEQHWINHNLKMLFCGPTGTGKTAYMEKTANAEESPKQYRKIWVMEA